MNFHFDEMISSPARLAILAVLVPGSPVSFAEMKTATGLADGNLHVQTHKLADAGYLKIRKARQGRRTEFSLTKRGLERFQLHVMKLQEILGLEAAVTRPRTLRQTRRHDDSAVWS